ncbi:conserved hypothetical protein [Ricinus communis]|uniref:SHSP domain-containing protein n=2 Tax=Ricinus communis TaxID=3988 RepID=B9SFJ6_RICCO|nr:conserved hypothetical protein [Ricinus communis]
MKVHPTLKKRNFIVSDHDGVVSSTTASPNPKKLKRLPHVFAKVLELPFNSNADVFLEETQDSFLFIADNASGDDGEETAADDFRAHVIKILPGVTKISVLKVAHSGNVGSCEDEEVNIDTWRFRLPSTACAEKTSAMCIGGQLVVTVPKVMNVENMVRDLEDDGHEKYDEYENLER